MLLTETAPAAVNPIPLREMAAHLRMASGFSDDGSEDSLLELYLRNATAVIERRTSKALITRSYLLQAACWNRAGHLRLPIGPVTSIESFEFIRTGSTVTLAPEEWVVEPGLGQQRVTGPGGAALRAIPHGALANLTLTAGFGQTWNTVPDDLRQAVLLLATHYYENRAGELEADAGMPFGVASILSRYQPVRI
jgi:uncharacterized phiE125 gp8 family phage protein